MDELDLGFSPSLGVDTCPRIYLVGAEDGKDGPVHAHQRPLGAVRAEFGHRYQRGSVQGSCDQCTEPLRRPAVLELVASGALPPGPAPAPGAASPPAAPMQPRLSTSKMTDYQRAIADAQYLEAKGVAPKYVEQAYATYKRDGICIETVTPVPEFNEEQALAAQNLALQIAEEIKLVGVMAVEMFVKGEQLFINELALRPHNSGHWTIEGAVTSQFEQHLRAILDLPLGETAMVAKWAVMGNVLGGTKSDMYRPYLHLMARTPALKFHQYRKEVRPGRKIGHVTITGDNLVELRQEVDHALAYMSGEIDE